MLWVVSDGGSNDAPLRYAPAARATMVRFPRLLKARRNNTILAPSFNGIPSFRADSKVPLLIRTMTQGLQSYQRCNLWLALKTSTSVLPFPNNLKLKNQKEYQQCNYPDISTKQTASPSPATILLDRQGPGCKSIKSFLQKPTMPTELSSTTARVTRSAAKDATAQVDKSQPPQKTI